MVGSKTMVHQDGIGIFMVVFFAVDAFENHRRIQKVQFPS